MRALSRSPRRIAAAVVLAVVAVTWVLGSRVASDARLHDAPLVLVGPEVVTAALVAELQSVKDDGVTVGGTQSREDALDALDRGEVVGVVELDLTGATDRLLLPEDRSPARDAALIDVVRATEDRHDRSVEVSGGHEGLSQVAYAGLAALAGYGFVLVLSLARGPVAATLRHGIGRLLGIAAAGTVGGALAAWSWSPEVGVVVGLVMVAVGTTTLAFEALAGLRGLIGAALGTLVAPVPLIGAGDPLLLAQPWRWVSDWTIVGAGARGIGIVGVQGFASGLVQPAIVVIGTVALSLAVLFSTRWMRARSTHRETEVDPVETGPGVPLSWTVQTGALVATVVVCCAVTVTFISPASPGPREPVASLASVSDCVGDTGQVSDVDDLNRIAEIRSAAELQGGDVGASALLQDGRTVWVFGDTLRAPDAPGPRVVRNSMLVVAPECLRAVRPRADGALIPDRHDGVGYWPMSVMVAEKTGYDLVSVTAQRVHTIDATDPFGFEALGPSIATFLVPAGEVPQLVSVTDLGPDDPATTSPMWGAATARDGGWAYLYGSSRPGEVEPATGFALRVARAPVDSVTDQRTWTYWDGEEWAGDAAAAIEVIASPEGTSQTLSVFAQGGTWYALSKQGEVLGDEIAVWTAPSPEGPFADPVDVADLPSNAAAGELRYMPLAHPYLLPEDGTMVVSYSQNNPDVNAIIDDPLLYRPRFLRVALP